LPDEAAGVVLSPGDGLPFAVWLLGIRERDRPVGDVAVARLVENGQVARVWTAADVHFLQSDHRFGGVHFDPDLGRVAQARRRIAHADAAAGHEREAVAPFASHLEHEGRFALVLRLLLVPAIAVAGHPQLDYRDAGLADVVHVEVQADFRAVD